jgi:hypothetical protein
VHADQLVFRVQNNQAADVCGDFDIMVSEIEPVAEPVAEPPCSALRISFGGLRLAHQRGGGNMGDLQPSGPGSSITKPRRKSP